jgi:hypothetical protein
MRWHIDTVVGWCRRTGHTPSASSSSAKQRADGSVDKRRISSLRSNHGETATTGAGLEHRNDTDGHARQDSSSGANILVVNRDATLHWPRLLSCYGHLQSVRLPLETPASLEPGPAWLSSSCPDRSSSNSILHTKSHANTLGNASNSSISSSFPAACLLAIFTLTVALLNSAFKIVSAVCSASSPHGLHCVLSSTHNACALFTLLNYNSSNLCLTISCTLQDFHMSRLDFPVS